MKQSPNIESTRSIEIFYCYAAEDKRQKDELDKHLSHLKRTKQITTWDRGEISPGNEWANQTEIHLNTAQLILLLISPDFMASDHCYHEMMRAMERDQAKEAVVIAIILRPVDYRDALFNEAIILPDEGKPIISCSNPDEAFLGIAEFVRKVADAIRFKEWVTEGYTHEKVEHYEEALFAYEQAIRLGPQKDFVYVREGYMLIQLGRYDEAINAYSQAIRINSSNASAYIGKGVALKGLDQWEESLSVFDRAIRLEPNNVYAYISKIGAYSYLRRYDEAIIAHNRIMELEINNAEIYYELGNVLLCAEKLCGAALEAYERAIQLDPSESALYVGKGHALTILSRYQEALIAYEQALYLNVNSYIARLGRGQVLREMGRLDEALVAFEEAIQLEPHLKDAYFDKGFLLYRLRRIEEAQQAFKEARELKSYLSHYEPEFTEFVSRKQGSSVAGQTQPPTVSTNH